MMRSQHGPIAWRLAAVLLACGCSDSERAPAPVPGVSTSAMDAGGTEDRGEIMVGEEGGLDLDDLPEAFVRDR